MVLNALHIVGDEAALAATALINIPGSSTLRHSSHYGST